MPYLVQFVGLVCFYRERGGRQVLLPDGSNPGPEIDPHYASIMVAPDAVEASSGWNGQAANGTFELPPCSIVLEGADVDGPLDVSRHEGRLPQLRQYDPDFEIDPDRAETVARLRIRRGTLAAYAIPGGDAAISQLEVPHDGPINVTVTPRDGSPARTLRLRPGTEIAVTNMARAGLYTPGAAERENGHFQIYEKLSVRPVTLADPPRRKSGLERSPSQHRLFTRGRPINLNTSCSNTGCC